MEMAVGEGPALDIKDSDGISWDRVTVVDPPSDNPLVNIINSRNIRITNCYQPDRKGTYLSKDNRSSGIYLMNNIFPGMPALKTGKSGSIESLNNITE